MAHTGEEGTPRVEEILEGRHQPLGPDVRPGRGGVEPGRSTDDLDRSAGGPELSGDRAQTILQARRETENFGFLVPIAEQTRRALRWLEAHPEGALLVQGRAMAPCFAAERAAFLGLAHRREWYLVEPTAVVPGCEGRLVDGESSGPG